jgi:hypothetical protein
MMIYMSGKLLKNTSTEKVAGDGMVGVASRRPRRELGLQPGLSGAGGEDGRAEVGEPGVAARVE